MNARFRTRARVLIARPLPVSDTLGGVREAFSASRAKAWGFIAPQEGSLPSLASGQQARETRVLLLPRGTDIRVRDGLWMEDAGEAPAWRCVRVDTFPLHVRAVAERRTL
ncbi:MAG: hypothetical protein IJS53_02030 [Clostridia bacterium]|nr:hypothetical protein [Clostridia bacterium]